MILLLAFCSGCFLVKRAEREAGAAASIGSFTTPGENLSGSTFILGANDDDFLPKLIETDNGGLLIAFTRENNASSVCNREEGDTLWGVHVLTRSNPSSGTFTSVTPVPAAFSGATGFVNVANKRHQQITGTSRDGVMLVYASYQRCGRFNGKLTLVEFTGSALTQVNTFDPSSTEYVAGVDLAPIVISSSTVGFAIGLRRFATTNWRAHYTIYNNSSGTFSSITNPDTSTFIQNVGASDNAFYLRMASNHSDGNTVFFTHFEQAGSGATTLVAKKYVVSTATLTRIASSFSLSSGDTIKSLDTVVEPQTGKFFVALDISRSTGDREIKLFEYNAGSDTFTDRGFVSTADPAPTSPKDYRYPSLAASGGKVYLSCTESGRGMIFRYDTTSNSYTALGDAIFNNDTSRAIIFSDIIIHSNGKGYVAWQELTSTENPCDGDEFLSRVFVRELSGI